METRAHFVLIGLFTILGILGVLGSFLWLTGTQIDRQYASYGVLFDDVSGLSQSADVSFNGVGVGRVVGIRIWEHNPSKVFVEIEIDATTPVGVDTMAQLASQGVTGVAFIALSGGSANAERLQPIPLSALPIIPSRQSSLRSLVNSAPDLLGEAATLIKQLEGITGPENQETLAQVLQNVERATGRLEVVLTDFSEVLETVQIAAVDITEFTATLEQIGADVQTTLDATDDTLGVVSDTFANATEKLDATGPAIASFEAASDAINRLASNDLTALVDDIENTLDTTDQAFARMDITFADAQELIATNIDPIIAETQNALSAFAETMTITRAEVPGLMADLRATSGELRTAFVTVQPGLRDFGRLATEARNLVQSISAVVTKLSRDPSRLLLDNRVPDYRR